MKRIVHVFVTIFLVVALSGCVSGRYQGEGSDQNSAIDLAVIPTLEAPEERGRLETASMLPTWTPADSAPNPDYTAPTDLDSEIAIPRSYLEEMGLTPAEGQINLLYPVINGFSVRPLFTNHWRLPALNTGTIFAVDDYRFEVTETLYAPYVLTESRSEFMTFSIAYDVEDLSTSLPLGEESYVLRFSRSGTQIYVAQFIWGRTIGTVMISGDDSLTQDQAFETFMLAATSVGYDPNYVLEVDESDQGFEGLVGFWAARQRSIEILPDGSAILYLGSGCCNSLTYLLKVDVDSQPITATVLEIEVLGDNPPTSTINVGDPVQIERRPNPMGDFVVVLIPGGSDDTYREVNMCLLNAMAPCDP